MNLSSENQFQSLLSKRNVYRYSAGTLSSLQLESIVYAWMKFECRLTQGSGMGALDVGGPVHVDSPRPIAERRLVSTLVPGM
jgi:hypothetical protein